MSEKFESFREFYPYYLSEHRNRTCRALHLVGTGLVVLIVAVVVWTANPWWLLAVPVAGYGFAWVGHFFFEHNRPATFTHPLYSLAGDWVMFFEVLTRRRGLSDNDKLE